MLYDYSGEKGLIIPSPAPVPVRVKGRVEIMSVCCSILSLLFVWVGRPYDMCGLLVLHGPVPQVSSIHHALFAGRPGSYRVKLINVSNASVTT